MSNGAVEFPCESGRLAAATNQVSATKTAASQKESWKDNTWATTLVMGYPIPTPTAAVIDNVAMVRSATAGGSVVRAMVMHTGTRPRPMP